MKNEQSPQKEQIVFGTDSLVVRKCLADVQGGRTLDCTGFIKDVIKAGHVIIKLASGNYAPMPVKAAVAANGSDPAVPEGYDTLPSGASYVGILKGTIKVSSPTATILTAGVVNSELVPYPMNSILAAFKAAVPTIIFEKDEEA